MGETPCEDKRRKGASPMDGARATFHMDVNRSVPRKLRDKQLVLPHAEVWRRNIYAFKPAHYYFLHWNQS